MITLIKPQFEVGRGQVGSGGIVRDEEQHRRVVAEVNALAESIGLQLVNVIDSPILGAEGNKEFLAFYSR
jgi:23S rRNA (cytidine1920-2'-O)/16S rRNA (cytidine1409-2'-O)-methyltransferase